MQVIDTQLDDVKIIEPKVFGDDRGFFFESYNHKQFCQATGFTGSFVQDNHSKSAQGVLRGLHYQLQHTQGKLIRVVAGEIFDVAVDIRKDSPQFGQWIGVMLSAENKRQLWVPEGFAHGFYTVSSSAEVLYKATDFYAPEHERSIVWNDPQIGIEWPITVEPLVSEKDAKGVLLKQAEVF